MVDVSWKDLGRTRALCVTFDGHLDAEEAREALKEIEERLGEIDGPVVMLWDARAMTGFDTRAREAWQEAMAGWKERVESIELIATRLLVRTGGRVIRIFTGLPIAIHDEMSSVERKYA